MKGLISKLYVRVKDFHYVTIVLILSKLPVLRGYIFRNWSVRLKLLENAENLMVDTRKRIVSSNDVDTSLEIMREDLTLATQNLNEFEKIYTIYFVRYVWMPADYLYYYGLSLKCSCWIY